MKTVLTLQKALEMHCGKCSTYLGLETAPLSLHCFDVERSFLKYVSQKSPFMEMQYQIDGVKYKKKKTYVGTKLPIHNATKPKQFLGSSSVL